MIPEVKKVNNAIDEIILKNDFLEVHVLSLGGTLKNIIFAGKDVLLGYDDPMDYLRYDGYLGALVGRVANRIAKGTFTLNGRTYHLPINNGPNNIHGGIHGFSYRVFDYILKDNQVVFHYVSPDGQEGFPGTLDFYAFYTLKDQALSLRYEAISDADTLINITNHAYFNLSGKASYIGDHALRVKADRFAHVNADGLVTGEIEKVAGTPFDYRQAHLIDDVLKSNHEQIQVAKGLDHPFIFTADHDQVELTSKQSGISLTVSTSLPQAQLYTANYLDGRMGKSTPMNAQDALCIETQFMPDGIHQEKSPMSLLQKGEEYQAETIYTFTKK